MKERGTEIVSKVQSASSPLEYMRQLDGLRAIAVTGAIIQHYSWGRIPLIFPWGVLGTRLFFVISGFLITGILMKSRAEVRQGQPVLLAIRQFYGRRFLRILPIYYAALFGFWLGSHEFRSSHELGWFLTFAQNIKFAIAGEYTFATHLWTLAVEEQFYLFWPFLILLAPRKWLIPSVLSVIAIGPLSRLLGAAATLHQPIPFWLNVDVLTTSCLDTLAMGSLLAIAVHSRRLSSDPERLEMFAPGVLANGSLAIGLPSIAIYVWLNYTMAFPEIMIVLRNLACALVFVWVVWRASTGFGGWVGRALSSAPLVYLGRISYGLYLYHFFLINPIRRAVARWLPSFGPQSWLEVGLLVAASLGVASVSWFLLEKPINTLKRYLPYDARTAR